MLTTGEALEAVLRSLPTLPTVRAELERCTARALRQTVIAERDQPPFDRVTMDGIAVEHASFAGGQRRFPLQSLQAAGDPALTLEAGNAIEIMTGAALPSGAGLHRSRGTHRDSRRHGDDRARVRSGGSAVHPSRRASDHAQGTVLLRPGIRIGAPELAVIASCGLTRSTSPGRRPYRCLAPAIDWLRRAGRSPLTRYACRTALRSRPCSPCTATRRRGHRHLPRTMKSC